MDHPVGCQVKPAIEPLEDRTAPALLASQVPLVLPVLDPGEVKDLLARAAAATASDDAIIAIVDRGGNILGVRVEGGVSPAITGSSDILAFAVDGALAKARTAAFFANDTAPLTSRTIRFISQSTMIEREVNSNPNIPVAASTLRGPGFVAPIGLGGHFPPDIPFTPQVDLFNIEHTNRDGFVHPGADHIKGTADDTTLPNRFNVTAILGDTIAMLTPPASYGETILTPADRATPAINKFTPRGIATLPGGIPLYQHGVLVGGIGVFFPGTTGFASEENSSMNVNFDPSKPDRTLEAEFIGLAAAGGSRGAGFPVGTLGGIPALTGFDIPFGRIDLVGITLDVIGPGGDQGPRTLVDFAQAHFGVGLGSAASGMDIKVDSAGTLYKAGTSVPEGWIVQPRAGASITAAEVQRIIEQGITEANRVRAQIRLPLDERSRMVFAVADSDGTVLGLYRMPDATVFSIDVAVAKARNVAYYDDPAQLAAVDQVPGLPKGVSFTARTFRYLSLPRFPEGIEGSPPGFFSILNDPGINRGNGLNQGPLQPANAFQTVVGFDAFNPGSNFRDSTIAENQNGVVFFPGSSAVYKNQTIVAGFGVSGDGVDQDDVVTVGGIAGFAAPDNLRADQFFVSGIRLPYFKLPRNPHG